ncbi:MAG: T9SS C-terminal target domain-containing protein, partial [Bacteroidota bacterium]
MFVIGSATAQITKVITDADLVGSTTYNWSADTIYQLDGYVYLEADGVLNIAPGTRIEGLANPSDANDLASTLIITRDATITANGTAAQPIVFTAEGEDENFSVPDDRGSWGGLVILGNAPVGEENATGVANIEGIPQEARTQYGGTNVNDNSGSLRYVSIRYGGAVLADNNEINGLTLGGVGNGTLIEFIEVFGNNDDGIEFFGGSVDVKHAIVAFCKDDSFDSDQAWSGRGQFWFTIQLPNDQTGNNQNGG